jgi:putative membrane-bound dehydrogenase-like protein
MAFDEEGRLWVVEMRDYPNGPAKGQPPEGRVVILEDRDGYGRYKLSRVFADKLLFANGLMPWRGGAIVTCAPHILYLHDSTNQGKADRREILFEGFAAGNPQLRVNHPLLGIDNWIYVSNGLLGGTIRRAGRKDAESVNISGRDFRFDLIHDRYESVTGMGQYGNTFDDWGRRFVCNNRTHVIPLVMPDRYVRRNPFLAVPQPVGANQNPGGAARIYPLSKNWTTSSLHTGTFTAACGVTVYRGDLLPADFRGAVFTCEPTGNLVHQEHLMLDGAGFRHRPAREGVEFLATPDDWFRPVNLAHGPDGALYVVDMYRAVIEHPEWVPAELRNPPDLLFGKDKGRIWRIVPEKAGKKRARPQLSQAGTPELVALLAHPDVWWRTTAQRLLLERQDKSALEPLRKLCLSSDRPLARLHAAWLLEASNALDADLVLQLLRDQEPRVRENAVQFAEKWLAKNKTVQKRIIALAADADARLRFQVALSLGEWDDDQIVPPLARIALAGADDRWTRLAVASSVPRRAGALIVTLGRMEKELADQPSVSRLRLLRELAELVGGRQDRGEVADVLDALVKLPSKDKAAWQMAVLEGLVEGMGRRGTQLGVFLASLPEARKPLVEQTTALLNQAADAALDPKRRLDDRLAAVRLLAHAPWKTAGPALTHLVTDDTAQEIRLAAVRALAAHSRSEVADLLLKSWRGYTPAMRREVTEAMLSQPDRALAFLDAVESGRVKPGDLDPQRSRQLLNHRRDDIRMRARKLLTNNLPADRKKVLEKYKAALKLEGDAGRGKAVFQKNCATCHVIAGMGIAVGPDIGDTRVKTREALLVDILDPNAAIDSNYVSYTITTKRGKVLTGLIASESASSITLKRAENQTEVMLRQDIEQIESSGVSLMPAEMEKTISIEEMADLLNFLKNWRYEGTP